MRKVLFLIPLLAIVMTNHAKDCSNIAVSIAGNTPACDSVYLNAAVTGSYGGNTYDWSGGSSTGTQADTFITTGTYTVSVTVTDDSGCVASNTRSITVNPKPSPAIVGPISGCSPVILTATGGSTYAWSGGDNPNGATNGITSSGNYTVTVTSSAGCSSSTASGNETVRPSPSALITAGSATRFCSGGSVLLTAPSNGNAINFAGRGYVSATGYNVGTSAFTVEAWIYPLGTGRGVIVSQGGVNCGAASYLFEYNNDTLILQTSTSSGCQGTVKAPNSLVLNQWQHVAASVTRGGNLTMLYVNGVQVASGNISAGNIGSTSLTIGGSSTTGYDFNGVIDEARVWNIALSQTAIQSSQYSIIPSNSSGLVTYYRFDEGSGTAPVDIAGGNTGAFTGALVWQTPSSSPVFENGGTSLLYNWSSGSVDQAVEATVTGSYVVLVTNTTNACTATDTVLVTVDTIPTATITPVTSLCPGSNISLAANGGSTYAWSGPNGFTSAQQDTTLDNVTTAAGGEYSVTVSTTNNCTATKFQDVGVYSQPVVSIQGNSPQCLGSTLFLNAGGGLSYAWSGPNGFSSSSEDTSISSVVTASGGAYHVTVTDANGCTASATYNDTVNALPTPTASSSNSPVCAGTTLYLNATGGVSYTWSGPNNNVSFTSSDSIVNVTVAAIGTYYVTVTDANGCSATDSVQASVNALPAAAAGSNSPLCVGAALNLTSSGGVSYSWSGPGFTSSAQDTTIAGGSVTAGSYTVTVTDNNACSATAGVTVTVNSPPASPGAGSSGPVCAGSSLTLSASSADSYSWSGPNGFTSSSQSPVIGTSLSADSGLYSVTVTTNGCSATASVNAIVNASPNATATNSTIGSQCAGENIYLYASGGISYTWSGPIGYESNNQNDTILAATAAATGTYTVTVTNGNGCSVTASTSLIVIDVPAIAIAGLNDTICAGETLELSADGGLTYTWSGPNGFTSQRQDTSIAHVTLAAAGTYTVTATNSGGCLATANTTIVVETLPVIASCPGNITVNATSGQCSAVVNFNLTLSGLTPANIWYSQNPGTVFPVGTTPIVAGAYNSCGSVTCNFTVTVVDNQPPVFTCPGNITILASEATDTRIVTIPAVTATDNCGNGTATVTNSINGTNNATGTYPAGTTTVVWTATDINGNTATCSQTIIILPNLVLSGTSTNTLCPGTFFGTVNTLVAGGQTPYTYKWSNSSTAPNLSNLPAGSYTVTVIDAANDTVSKTFVVETVIPLYDPATPGPITGPAYVCTGATATYSIAAVPNTVSYSWTVPSNATIVSGQGSAQLTVRFPTSTSGGNLQVWAINCVGVSNSAQMQVSIITAPSKPGSIQGAANVCAAGAVYQYFVSPPSNPSSNSPSSYTWTAPTNASIASGQGTNAVSVKFNTGYTTGALSVIASNCAANSAATTLTVAVSTHAPSAMDDIDVYPSLGEPGAVCPGDTVSYTVLNDVPANYVANYNWATPANSAIIAGQGTQVITVAFHSGYAGGNITVYGSNCIGNGTSTSQSIPLNTQVPSSPCIPFWISQISQVSGGFQNTACPGDTLIYSINSVSNARSYTWTVPANTTLISGQGTTTVEFVVQPAFSSGNLSVYASNCAGNGAASYQFIDISNPTSSPGNIQGPNFVCTGYSYNYTVGAAYGDVESYVWTVPTGATILSGQGTMSIYVLYQNGFTSGTVSVYAANCIINSYPVSQPVYLATQVPSWSAIISGPSNICIGTTNTYTAQWVSSATAYTWAVPANTTILSGQGSTTITLQVNTGYTGGTLSVIPSNCIGNGPASTERLTHSNCGANEATGVDEVDPVSAMDVRVYPNPFNEQFVLKVTSPSNEPINMKIFDLTGKVVGEGENLSNTEEITVGGKLESGVYLIQVRQGEDVKVLRIIKMNN